MKKIELTQGQSAVVDEKWYKELNQYKWYAVKWLNVYYAIRNSPKIEGKRHSIRMHHTIIGKPEKGFEVDHKDGNGLNNCISNLRFVTPRQNQQNLKNIIKSSKYPGVGWHKYAQKWRAYIKINGIQKSLGYFISEKEAFNAYYVAVNSIGQQVVDGW